MAFNKQKYDAEFQRQAYDRIAYRVPKGKRLLLQEQAKKLNISVNQLITDALEKTYHISISN